MPCSVGRNILAADSTFTLAGNANDRELLVVLMLQKQYEFPIVYWYRNLLAINITHREKHFKHTAPILPRLLSNNCIPSASLAQSLSSSRHNKSDQSSTMDYSPKWMIPKRDIKIGIGRGSKTMAKFSLFHQIIQAMSGIIKHLNIFHDCIIQKWYLVSSDSKDSCLFVWFSSLIKKWNKLGTFPVKEDFLFIKVVSP